MLIERTWGLIVGWIVLIVLSLRSDRSPARLRALEPVEQRVEALAVAAPRQGQALGMQRAEWVRQREAEQAGELQAERYSLTRRLISEGVFWGSLAGLLWILLLGLVAFCFAFGMPGVGGISADFLLHALGCSAPAEVSTSPWIDSCGFWTERLAPYRQPFFGALLAPVLLFTQFHDVLLVWISVILLLGLAPLLRIGAAVVAARTQPIAVLVVAILLGLCLLALVLGQSYDLAGWVSRPTSGGLSPPVNALMATTMFAALVLLGIVATVILFIVLLGRHAVGRGQSAPAQGDEERKPGSPDRSLK